MANVDSKEGLEGKLLVHFGDLIVLKSTIIDVAGFVITHNDKTVKLSHENPNSVFHGTDIHFSGKRRSFTSGNRVYNLKRFESYDVLIPYVPVENRD